MDSSHEQSIKANRTPTMPNVSHSHDRPAGVFTESVELNINRKPHAPYNNQYKAGATMDEPALRRPCGSVRSISGPRRGGYGPTTRCQRGSGARFRYHVGRNPGWNRSGTKPQSFPNSLKDSQTLGPFHRSKRYFKSPTLTPTFTWQHK